MPTKHLAPWDVRKRREVTQAGWSNPWQQEGKVSRHPSLPRPIGDREEGWKYQTAVVWGGGVVYFHSHSYAPARNNNINKQTLELKPQFPCTPGGKAPLLSFSLLSSSLTTSHCCWEEEWGEALSPSLCVSLSSIPVCSQIRPPPLQQRWRWQLLIVRIGAHDEEGGVAAAVVAAAGSLSVQGRVTRHTQDSISVGLALTGVRSH